MRTGILKANKRKEKLTLVKKICQIDSRKHREEWLLYYLNENPEEIVVPVNKADICIHQIVVNIIKMIQRHTAAKPIYTNQKLIKTYKTEYIFNP